MHLPVHPSSALPARRAAAGFTLIELMITIAVAAILLMIAAPSFTSLINSNRLTSSANEMVGVLQSARMEAVRTSSTVSVCVDCDGAGSMIAYVDANDDDSFNAGEEIIRRATANSEVQINSGANIAFRADGLGRASDGSLADVDFGFCMPTTRPAENNRTVQVGSGSRISTTRSDSGGSC